MEKKCTITLKEMIFITFRTDLAIETSENILKENTDFKKKVKILDDLKIVEIEILTPKSAQKIGKAPGTYVTIELPHFTDNYENIEAKVKHISEEIKKLLPEKGLVLVVGLGNSNITPDALGPATIDSVLATRHITGELARSTGLDNLRPVAALAPGVLGQTGIEVNEIISSISKNIRPVAIIAVDALAAKETSRLGSTIQISNAGISPGSGVGNARPAIDQRTIGVPVISVGVPTVVDALTLATNVVDFFGKNQQKDIENKVNPNHTQMMVTPREIDILIERAANITAMAINCALHSKFSYKELLELIS